MELRVTLKGEREAVAALNLLGRRMETEILPEAGLAGGNVILEEVKARTPTDSRQLLESLGLVVVAGPGQLRIFVKPQPGRQWYGASSGWRGVGKLHDPEEYGVFQEEGFYHVLAGRRIKAKRFMRRGFAAGRDRAVRRIRDVVKTRLEEATLTLGRGL